MRLLKYLSLVICCKDRERNLSYCLQSVKRNTVVPNVVIVDFGSKKNLMYLEREHPFVKVIRVKTSTEVFSKPRGYNIAIKRSKSNHMCFTDADQLFQDNFFEELNNTIITNPKKIFITCKTRRIRKELQFKKEEVHTYYPALLATALKEERLYGDGCCFCIDTSWLKKVRGYDEAYIGHGAQSSDIRLRAYYSGYTQRGLTRQTSTLHMPHEKFGDYYDASIDKRNRNRYHKKRVHYKKIARRITLEKLAANTNTSWGVL